jgi:hypothetical protein
MLRRQEEYKECRFLQEPHGVTSQKMAFFIVTAVKTSNYKKSTLHLPFSNFLYFVIVKYYNKMNLGK